MDQEVLTDQETAVYDRQIRVWGVDAQRRLSKSRVLVIGVTGVVAELCKNIVLAGIGSLTLMDDSPVTWEASLSNFLIPGEEAVNEGKSIAEVCQHSLRDFNPMVHVSVEKGNVTDMAADYLDKFDAVVLGRASIAIKKQVNEMCRKRPQRVAFYSVDCRGSCGEIFVDLQNHTYTQEVIKAMSCKGDPLKNFFFFDVMDGKGIIEDISN